MPLTCSGSIYVIGSSLAPFGDFLLALADERGVDCAAVVRDPSSPTSATVEELDHERLFAGRGLHVGGALVMEGLDGEPFARILAEAKARGLLASVDTVWDPSGRWDRLLPMLPYVDLATPSLAEAQAITGEGDAERAAAARLHDLGAREVVLKLGADGCFVHGLGRLAPVPVDAVDGTGAGDAFAQAFSTAGSWAGRSSVPPVSRTLQARWPRPRSAPLRAFAASRRHWRRPG